MKTINFVKVYRKKSMGKINLDGKLLIIIALVILGSANVYDYLGRDSYSKKDLAYISSQLTANLTSLKKLESSIEDSKSQSYDTLVYSKEARDILGLLPRAVYIERLDMKIDGISLIGYAAARENVFLYLDRLNMDEKNYELRGLDEDIDIKEYRFIIESEFREVGEVID